MPELIAPSSLVAGVLAVNGFIESDDCESWSRIVTSLATGATYTIRLVAPPVGVLGVRVVVLNSAGSIVGDNVGTLAEVASDAVALAYSLAR